ncbi:hypothetical protein H2204_004657 [Knufia peltigerae]|uniref:Uncharacterized protein n=1 Tax=Knufia peltigerae TaxID=1002370 RepID=A0AA38Y8B1_9EURO|nr:hypothetical protein H2204_004657 [Knufia peltigerae]
MCKAESQGETYELGIAPKKHLSKIFCRPQPASRRNASSSGPRIIREKIGPKGAGPSHLVRESSAPAQRGTLLRRSNTGPGAAARAGAATTQPGQRQNINRTSTPGSRPSPPGPVLRRTGPPRDGTSSRPPFQRSGQRSSQPGKAPAGRGTGPRVDKRIQRRDQRKARKAAEDEDADEDLEIEEKVDHWVNTVIDPPPNPTEEITYTPGQNMAVKDLRADWPNTPLSGTGLTETVQQRIEWLAHRIPHGYQTPGQLAERYVKGYFTRFESEEEKAEVLKLAAEMAQKRADRVTERKNIEAKPHDMSFSDVVSRQTERQGLADTYVRGDYPTVRKQKMPFLDHVVENLNNNGTYQGTQTKQFMKTIRRLMAAGHPSQAPKPAAPKQVSKRA